MIRILASATLVLLAAVHAGAENAGIDWVPVPPGRFRMGAPGVAEPVHEVELSYPYLISRTELSNRLVVEALQFALDHGLAQVDGGWVRAWDQNLVRVDLKERQFHEIRFDSLAARFWIRPGEGVDGAWGPGHLPYEARDCPAQYLTWYGAAAICDWLSLRDGLEPSYNGSGDLPDGPLAARGYRLPTEAEWEYAARWPDGRSQPWGEALLSCELANARPRGDYCVGWTLPVGSRPAGASHLGLLDLVGNVNEWIHDWSAPYPDRPRVNPVEPRHGEEKILRGGSWTARDYETHLAMRRDEPPGADSGHPWYAGSFGLRLVRVTPP
jgi:formylglycine-generating enzyme required for sulfatase activity